MFQGTGFAAASTSSPFGQTAFGKPATTGFNAPVFGTNTGSSLFGGVTTQQSGLFGGSAATPAFGQAQTTQPTFGTAFTSTSAGASTGLFGAQPSTANTGGLFGSNTTSAFGQTKPNAFSGFGTSTVGQTSAPTAQPGTGSLFGQPQTQSASGLFGASTGFAATGGTTFKFTPVTGTDTMIKNGVTSNINTRHHCITCMKEYENKSLEELRLEDYAANRKGPRQGTQTGTVFGTSGQMSLFGASTSTAGTTSNLFGATNDNKSLLGNTTNTGFGTGGGGVFGTTTSNLFGKPTGAATPFGAPTSTTASTFGFNTTANTNPFGTNTAQKPFGATTPQTGLFGATSQPSAGFGTGTPGFGTFGTSQPSLFGDQKSTFGLGTNAGFSLTQPASTSTPTLFGGQKQTLGFGTGGFAQPATTSTAPSVFGTPFGQQQQSQLLGGATGGLKTTSTGFTFGPSTNTLGGNLTGSGGGSVFGQQAQKPGGLFGTNNMGGTGLFGGNNMNSFGSNMMFNTGSNTLSGTGTTGGLGSSGGLGSLGSLGGGLNQSNQLGGNVPAQFVNPIHQHLSTFTALPYGNSPIFKNILKAPSESKVNDLLKPTSPAAQKALLSGQNYKISSKPTSKLKIKPVETNTLTKKALFDELDAEDNVITNGGNTEQWPVVSRRRLLIKPVIFSIPGNSVVSPLVSALQKRNSLNSSGNNVNIDSNIPNIDATRMTTPLKHSTTLFYSPTNQKQSTSSVSASQQQTHKLEQTDSHLAAETYLSSGNKKNRSLDCSTVFNSVEGSPRDNLETVADQSTTSSSDSDQDESIPTELDSSNVGVRHPTGITLRRAGYYTIPSLDELACLVDDQGRCIVDNFTVGRLNYGNIFYPDSFDVAGLNLDEIVHFRHKEVTVYPNEATRPTVGEGLNRRAQVTLDRVWPVDKTTRLPITDPDRILAMDYESKLSRACAKHGTNYVEYRPTTGSWVFKVDHFSKYGLSDSDEDEVSTVDIKKIKLGVGAQSKAVSLLHQQQNVPQLHIPSKQVEDALTALMAEEDEEMDDGITSPFDLDEELERRTLSPTAKLARHSGTNARKLQMMKASFFDRTNFNIDGESLDFDDIAVNNGGVIGENELHDMKVNNFRRLSDTLSWYHRQGAADLLNMSQYADVADRRISKDDEYLKLKRVSDTGHQITEDVSEVEDSIVKQSSDLPTKLFPYVQPKIFDIRLLTQNEVNKLDGIESNIDATSYIADLGFYQGSKFRVGSGPRNLFSVLTSSCNQTGEEIHENQLICPSFAALHMFRLSSLVNDNLNENQFKFEDSVLRHLEAALSASELTQTENGPKISPRSGTDGLETHHNIANELFKTCKSDHFNLMDRVFGLMHALWVHHEGMKGCTSGGNDHSCLMLRKAAVSEWLESTLSEAVLQKASNCNEAGAIFAYMTGLKLTEACEKAREIGDLQLSLLLSQVRGPMAVQELVRRQLIQWYETEADRFITTDRLKCYLLVAGLPIHKASGDFVNTCENLDWLTSFSIHFWYGNSVSNSVTDALIAYDTAYKGDNSYASPPFPSYYKDYEVKLSKNFGDKEQSYQVYDIMYHLLHLFSDNSYPLEQFLNPATHTPDQLDYRIVWFVSRILTSIGYAHLSELAASIIHSSFADQLETHGLWEWAVFVLLHLKQDVKRELAVKSVIDRFITVDEDSPKEEFLIQRLSIPKPWVYESKATKAMYLQRYEDAARYLIQAEEWKKCHDLIIQHISSRALVNERYEYLEDLLSQLELKKQLIDGWSDGGGGTILQYLRVARKVDELVAARDPINLAYHLEEMQPELSNLCHSIRMVPCKTPLDRLAQCEMSERTAHLLQNLIIGSTSEQENDEENPGLLSGCVDALASLITELPLPSDYKIEQWLGVVNLWEKKCRNS